MNSREPLQHRFFFTRTSRWALAALWLLSLSACSWRFGLSSVSLRAEQAQTWQGEVSCPGCSERWLTLTLFPDGLFRLRETYVGSQGMAEERFHDVGQWSALLQDSHRLILKGASTRQLRLNKDGDLLMLDDSGNSIVSIRDYVLKRQAKVDFIADPMRLLALYAAPDDTARSAVLIECLTSQVVRIPDTPAALVMQQQIQRISPERRARGPVLASFTASWRDNIAQSSAARQGSAGRVLMIERFERFWPNDTCGQGPIAAAQPLQETIWQLSSLNGLAIQEAILGRAAHIRLRKGGRLTGSTGCNRLQGGWQASADKLDLSRISSTRATCRGAMAQQEQVLLDVLRNASSFRQVGRQLELLQNEQVLARFVAMEML